MPQKEKSVSKKVHSIQDESVRAHEAHGGKIEICGTMPLTSAHDLSVAYTPGVAGPCLAIEKNPTRAQKMLGTKKTVLIVTDGSAVLGLGNIGPLASLPVMEGKALIFKKFGGISAFPLALDTQDTEEIIETVERIAVGFGGVNLEDISAPRCFEIEKRLQRALDIPVIHDDQNGSAIAVLAGLINALKLRAGTRGLDKKIKIIINGAGAAGIAIGKLLLAYGFTNIIMHDSHGAIYRGRAHLNPEKEKIARRTNKAQRRGILEENIAGADVFIGVSKAGVLKKQMVEKMAPKPIIFAMANPNPEIEPAEAKKAGAYIVATGRSDYPNQVNNALVFPGLFRGALENNLKRFDEKIFIRVAEALAQTVSKPTREKILPSIFNPAVVANIVRVFKTTRNN